MIRSWTSAAIRRRSCSTAEAIAGSSAASLEDPLLPCVVRESCPGSLSAARLRCGILPPEVSSACVPCSCSARMLHRTGAQAEKPFPTAGDHSMRPQSIGCFVRRLGPVRARVLAPRASGPRRSVHCPCLRVPRVDVRGSYRISRPGEIRKLVKKPCKKLPICARTAPLIVRTSALPATVSDAGGWALTRAATRAVRLAIGGSVQGVGFRAATQQRALALGVQGMGAQRTRRARSACTRRVLPRRSIACSSSWPRARPARRSAELACTEVPVEGHEQFAIRGVSAGCSSCRSTPRARTISTCAWRWAG